MGSTVVVGLVSLLFTLLYLGGSVDPQGNMRDLPVGLVNADRGGTIDGKPARLGDTVTDQIAETSTNGKIAWQRIGRAEAQDLMAEGKLYGVLVVPENFTSSVAGLAGTGDTRAVRPTLTVLTNQSAGSVGSAMAGQASQHAVRAASSALGQELTAAAASRSTAGAAERLLLADPVQIEVRDGHPLGEKSGLGLTAFYYALILVVSGMLAANVLHGQVDTALGYGHTDMGPWRRQRPLAPASRAHTFGVAATLMLVLSIVMGSVIMASALGIVGMDGAHTAQLWLYSVCTVAAVGIGALALLAVIGTPGMLLVTIVFIAMAVPTSGATTPLEALPGFYRGLAEFEPLRQITGGVRSILYFDAQGDAGLTRAWVATGVALVAGLGFGIGATRFYDRRGLHRRPAHQNAAA
ncbi:YhgE/Pip domain-containing protein [Streptomyces antibioticus]|uniref:YhgE/Pip domain-containing protein n=1 Tax=Streptomyces antibioticus TaxID=1890 RepID=UPI0036A06746